MFGDTYMGELDDQQVAAKRVNVGVHQGALTDDDMTFIIEQVGRLRSVTSCAVWCDYFNLYLR